MARLVKGVNTADLDANFKDEVANEPGGEKVKFCFSCTGCTVSCPVTEINPEFNPRKILRKVVLGARKEVLESDLIWHCVSCYACYEYCPQGVRITDVMGALRRIAIQEERNGKIRILNDVRKFDSAFLSSLRKHGRFYEAGTVAQFILKTKGLAGLLGYVPMGLTMLGRMKLKIFPENVKSMEEIKHIFDELSEEI